MTLAPLTASLPASAPWKTDGPRVVAQAFPYQGSKRILASKILSLFPAQGISRLIEPFAGSAAISVAARHYDLASTVHISDVNAPLIALWDRIIEDPNELISTYTQMWNDQLDDPRSFYLKTREEFNASKKPELLLYLLCRCVKAAVRYSKSGDFNQGADHRRLGARPANIAERITSASKLMKTATTSTESYVGPLTGASRDEVVYMDPPYQGTSDVPDHRYLTGLQRAPFSEALQTAVDNNVSFIVSYDVVTDDNKYGMALPSELGLLHKHVSAGVSSQATLQGKKQVTVESLYISPALVERLGGASEIDKRLDLYP
ncbi:DNA adenine methylase [Streptomyces sp. NPDC048441]|uniref:DNA adenine methylase n=1 Tax=Streptomyces sp. NPDC048441 TaxID=3365552 RepID=UPI0037193627